ncbi:MAG: hypothetical protein GKC10_01720 [Methanosarcinales archaeon]|nr:hypothetical protein [Methanosarcinales archaeon]
MKEEKGRTNNSICDLIYELLSDVLFHPKHHMDGFKSLLASKSSKGNAAALKEAGETEAKAEAANEAVPGDGDGKGAEKNETAADGDDTSCAAPPASPQMTKSKSNTKFHCYQEELFTCLLGCVTVGNDSQEELGGGGGGEDERSRRTRVCNARDIIWLFPLLFDGFLLNSEKWHRQQRESSAAARHSKKRGHSSTSAAAEDLAKFQFRMFVEFHAILQRALETGKATQLFCFLRPYAADFSVWRLAPLHSL